jgi:DNA mismatch repair protein MutL
MTTHEPYEPTSRRVEVLPEALANQIAAGEVVERPASVVKELVENALDAGATRVLVDIEAAGRGLIRIVDDGAGMPAEDAARAVLRHATSKVRDASDLERIGTLGFRGEALPSIASVSRFLLVTRTAESEVATTVRIDGGAAPIIGVAAAAPGTRIEVRDLFWNVPARLKFLKTDATETQHVVELVKGFALGHPQVHFRLGTGGKQVVLDLPPVRRLGERVAQVLGHEVADRLHEVAAPGPPVRVSGFVSGPRSAKATASSITCFVNGRRVKDKVLYHAAVSAFGADLLVGRFPQAVLWVHLAPEDVDVNVHPTKAEVRFRRPDEVHTAVVAAIQAMLRQRPWAVSEPLPLDAALEPRAQSLPLERPERRPEPVPLTPRARPEPGPRPAGVASPRAPYGGAQKEPPRPPHLTSLRLGERPTALFSAERPAATSARPTRVLGMSSRDELIVADDGDGLVLIDLAAAVEVLTVARLLALPDPVPAQPLLVPARLDLAPHEARGLEGRLVAVASLGVWVEHFGGPTYQLLGLPLPALRASPSRVLAALATARGEGRDELAMAIGRAMASSAVGPALAALVAGSLDALVAEVMTTARLSDGRDHRGRRPWVRMSAAELARRFEG